MPKNAPNAPAMCPPRDGQPARPHVALDPRAPLSTTCAGCDRDMVRPFGRDRDDFVVVPSDFDEMFGGIASALGMALGDPTA